MGYTNKTTHYELPQYVATDKPKYLTDFNETMVAIDTQLYTNATAAETAQTAAEGAQSTADGAVSSIGTLNTQINGDPTDPSDTGLNGQVADNSGDIDTIQALLGNGTPTTSNQTVIGAINGLEGAIAPREDGADLANSYSIGEQFARGGSVYKALVPLTAGTAFASLTLNTDYAAADTLVEQIADVKDSVPDFTHEYALYDLQTSVSITADGVKTVSQLYKDLADACVSFFNSLPNQIFAWALGMNIFNAAHIPYSVNYWSNSADSFTLSGIFIENTAAGTQITRHAAVSTNTSYCYEREGKIASDGTYTPTDHSSEVPSDGTTFNIIFRTAKRIL